MHALEFLFFVALCFYSLAIWAHKFQRALRTWMIWVFGIGLTADISGTIFLCMVATTKWTFNLHTISGFLSLLIMAIHFIWALLAMIIGGRHEKYFKRYAIPAWYIWMIAFVSGIRV